LPVALSILIRSEAPGFLASIAFFFLDKPPKTKVKIIVRNTPTAAIAAGVDLREKTKKSIRRLFND
jgi:hypothetical protein